MCSPWLFWLETSIRLTVYEFVCMCWVPEDKASRRPPTLSSPNRTMQVCELMFATHAVNRAISGLEMQPK